MYYYLLFCVNIKTHEHFEHITMRASRKQLQKELSILRNYYSVEVCDYRAFKTKREAQQYNDNCEFDYARYKF